MGILIIISVYCEGKPNILCITDEIPVMPPGISLAGNKNIYVDIANKNVPTSKDTHANNERNLVEVIFLFISFSLNGF